MQKYLKNLSYINVLLISYEVAQSDEKLPLKWIKPRPLWVFWGWKLSGIQKSGKIMRKIYRKPNIRGVQNKEKHKRILCESFTDT